MQDDFVCGSDYENCLDPSGKYIVNGEVVIGSTPGVSGDVSNGALYDTWDYSGSNGATNAWDTSGTVSDYISKTVTQTAVEDTSSDMSKFLQYKIGFHDDNEDKNYGMCMSVLNKCQNVTYTNRGKDSKYNPANNVVKEYLQRTLVQIKAKQDEILAEYAEECLGDVTQCLSENGYDEEDTRSVGLATSACKAVITTCRSANGDNQPDQNLLQWVTENFSERSCATANAIGSYPDCTCKTKGEVYSPSRNMCGKPCDSDTATGFIVPYCTCKTEGHELNTTTGECAAPAPTA